VNTCERCSAKFSAFSRSLLAQLRSGILVGGVESWVRLKVFVAFQIYPLKRYVSYVSQNIVQSSFNLRKLLTEEDYNVS
jgi:hypothetical protein